MMPLVLSPRKYPTMQGLSSLIVKEEKPSYIPHDLLFKKLLKTFFEQFIEVFFPNFYRNIDFQSVKFVSEEIIPDAFKADQRRVDIVVEAKWKSTDSLIIVHVESQSYVQKDFNERMFHYYCIFYNKYRKSILPLALFTYDEPWNVDRFAIEFDTSKVVQFQYYPIHLKQLNWRDFMRVENPVSAALMSKMGYNEDERVKVTFEFVRMMQTLKIDRGKQEFLFQFFEMYLQLTEEEVEKLMAKIKRDPETFDLSSLPISFVERGKRIGREEGRIEGRLEGRLEAQELVAMNMLRDNFSIDQIMKYTSLDKERIRKLRDKL